MESQFPSTTKQDSFSIQMKIHPDPSPFTNYCISSLSPISTAQMSPSTEVASMASTASGARSAFDMSFSKAASKLEIVPKEKTHCKCVKSRCLKLYCECFASGQSCIGCSCKFCANKPVHFKARQKALKKYAEKHPKIPVSQIKATTVKGCFCKKSECVKKYCECFQNNLKCTESCKCVGCKNDDVLLPLKRPIFTSPNPLS